MINIDWNIIWTIFNLLVLFVLLRIFLFRPVTRMMEQRQQEIRDTIADADNQKQQAEALAAQYQAQLEQANQKAAELVEQGKAQAVRQAEQILADARKDAEKLLADARVQIAREQEQASAAVRDQVSALVLLTASKLMQKQMDEAANRELVNALLSEAGEKR